MANGELIYVSFDGQRFDDWLGARDLSTVRNVQVDDKFRSRITQGYIEGQPFALTIDTGAEQTCINSKIYYEIPSASRPPLEPLDFRLQGGGGEYFTMRGKASLTIEVAGARHQLPVAVGDDVRAQCLLGNDYIDIVDLDVLRTQLCVATPHGRAPFKAMRPTVPLSGVVVRARL